MRHLASRRATGTTSFIFPSSGKASVTHSQIRDRDGGVLAGSDIRTAS